MLESLDPNFFGKIMTEMLMFAIYSIISFRKKMNRNNWLKINARAELFLHTDGRERKGKGREEEEIGKWMMKHDLSLGSLLIQFRPELKYQNLIKFDLIYCRILYISIF
jgi:hypothetical protein